MRVPEKPKHGTACNGCGACCAAEPCYMAVEYIGAKDGPCPALEYEDGRMWCGLVRHASRYLDAGTPEPWKDQILGGMFATAIGVGMGCDMDDET